MEDAHRLQARGCRQPLLTPGGARYRAAAGDVVQLHNGGEWLDVRIIAAETSEFQGVVLAAYPVSDPMRPHTLGERHRLRFREAHVWRCVELQR